MRMRIYQSSAREDLIVFQFWWDRRPLSFYASDELVAPPDSTIQTGQDVQSLDLLKVEDYLLSKLYNC